MSIFGSRVLQRRKQLNLSQEELALRIGVSQHQISKYERGKNNPTAEVLNALADALGTTTDWLLGRTEITDLPIRGTGDLDDLELKLIRLIREKPRDERMKYVDFLEDF